VINIDERRILHDLERIAKAQLDAARKNLEDCQERESITFDAHQAALADVALAFIREDSAFEAWLAASRKLDVSP
jgi:hypothetical protein